MSDLRTAAHRVLAEYDNDSVGFKLFGALEDLRAALAEDALERMSEDERRLGIQMQPVLEPVAWQWLDTAHFRKKIPADSTPSEWRPLYTTPPQCKPLTEEEIGHICAPLGFAQLSPIEVARAIEKAHGIGGSNE